MTNLLIPTRQPVCQVDGKPIMKDAEPKGRLYLVAGRPMCAFHRLMLIPKGKINYRRLFARRGEEEKAKLDRIAAEEIKKQKEDNRILEIAAKSQEEAAKLHPETKL
jgi:hypothetical protein